MPDRLQIPGAALQQMAQRARQTRLRIGDAEGLAEPLAPDDRHVVDGSKKACRAQPFSAWRRGRGWEC